MFRFIADIMGADHVVAIGRARFALPLSNGRHCKVIPTPGRLPTPTKDGEGKREVAIIVVDSKRKLVSESNPLV